MMTSKEFRAIRKQLGLTQRSLARQLQVSESTIINQERSGQIPTLYEYAIRFLMVKRHMLDYEQSMNQAKQQFKHVI